MLLQADPTLADVPGFSSEQLASLARSIERKKQRLESDIHAYIRRKQRELALYEQELLAQYRESMCAEAQTQPPAHPAHMHAESPLPSLPAPASAPSSEGSGESSSPEERKRTKHTRVHKREKELFGLVTPIFLPLLEANDPPQAAKKKEKKRRHKDKGEASSTSPPSQERASPSRDASRANERASHRSKGSEKMEQDEGLEHASTPKEKQPSEARKKAKRPVVKKSSLRKNSTGERTRRKRVSLVIDDQIVLPADDCQEAPLTSPSETTISSNTSSVSFDDMIDPRLLPPNDTDLQEQDEPQDQPTATHHHLPSTSPATHTGPALSASPPAQSPPQTATRSYLDLDAPSAHVAIPKFASPSPIYASRPETAEAGEEVFSTYVGGLSGSGVDDVDQTGSLGYPSSLGASYMESYMQSRPLSVRMAAAEKAGLSPQEKEMLIKGGASDEPEDLDADMPVEVPAKGSRDDDDDEMEVIGSMEGF